MDWNAELAYFVTPRSGPMRAMRTLDDVKHAFLDDLTARSRHRRHWFLVGRSLLAAAENKTRLSVTFLTDALLMALEIEGWMTPQERMREATVHNFPARVGTTALSVTTADGACGMELPVCSAKAA